MLKKLAKAVVFTVSLIHLQAASAASGSCVDTFQTAEFQAIDLREPVDVNKLTEFFRPLRDQTCTFEQLEAYFHSKSAATFNKWPKIITFEIYNKSPPLSFANRMVIGVVVENGKIEDVAVAVGPG